MWAWYPFGAVGVLEIVCVEETAHDAVEPIGNVFHIVPKQFDILEVKDVSGGWVFLHLVLRRLVLEGIHGRELYP